MYLPTQASVIVSCTIGSLITAAGIIGAVLNRHTPESATENEKIVHKNNSRKLLPAMASAFLFAIGLVVSQMTLFSKIYGFLNMALIPKGAWDPTLLMVMGGGFAVSFLSYQWVDGFNIFNVRLDNLRYLHKYVIYAIAHLCPSIQCRTLVQSNVLYLKIRNAASSTSPRTRSLMSTSFLGKSCLESAGAHLAGVQVRQCFWLLQATPTFCLDGGRCFLLVPSLVSKSRVCRRE